MLLQWFFGALVIFHFFLVQPPLVLFVSIEEVFVFLYGQLSLRVFNGSVSSQASFFVPSNGSFSNLSSLSQGILCLLSLWGNHCHVASCWDFVGCRLWLVFKSASFTGFICFLNRLQLAEIQARHANFWSYWRESSWVFFRGVLVLSTYRLFFEKATWSLPTNTHWSHACIRLFRRGGIVNTASGLHFSLLDFFLNHV